MKMFDLFFPLRAFYYFMAEIECAFWPECRLVSTGADFHRFPVVPVAWLGE
jgi:hypothetical protein